MYGIAIKKKRKEKKWKEKVYMNIDTIKFTDFCYMYIESTNTVIYRPTHISILCVKSMCR